MPEIKPDLSDTNRCPSVHWNLPVQCALPAGHWVNWHEAWHPQTGNRIRYRRSMGLYRTNELRNGAWHDLEIPPPGGYCNDQRRDVEPTVRCTEPAGHGWNHVAVVDGCRHSWNTPLPKALDAAQLGYDVQLLRSLVVQLTGELTEANTKLEIAERQTRERDERVTNLEATLERYVGRDPTVAEEMAYLNRCLNTVHDVCNAAEKQATRWEQPLPVPEWVAAVRHAASGGVLVEDDFDERAVPA